MSTAETAGGAVHRAEVTVPHLQTALVRAPDRVVVRLTGDVDASTAPQLVRALQESAVTGAGAVVVDVAGARFGDSWGLRELASFTDALAPAGRRCRIVGAPADTRRLVRSAGLAGRLELDGPVDPDVTVPAPRAPTPVRRPGPPYQVRPGRRTEERPVRRSLRPGTPRRWR